MNSFAIKLTVDKVFGFLEVVVKSGRAETNSGSGATSINYRPWEEVHKSLSEAMKERLAPYDGFMMEPHEIRGTFEECRFKARIASTESIDADHRRKTAKVTIDVSNSGITFAPGDRVMIMPENSPSDMERVVCALDLNESLDKPVPLNDDWTRYLCHLINVNRGDRPRYLSVRDILRQGTLAPLTKNLVSKVTRVWNLWLSAQVYSAIGESSSTVAKVLQSNTWPVQGSLGDLLLAARLEVSKETWSRAFPRGDLSLLPRFISVEVPRTYNISNFSQTILPSFVELTVKRSEHKVWSGFQSSYNDGVRAGVSSGFLNPFPFSENTNLKNEVYIVIDKADVFRSLLEYLNPSISNFRQFLRPQ